MDWIYSWFYTTPETATTTVPIDSSAPSDLPATEVVTTVKPETPNPVDNLLKVNSDAESNPPDLIPHLDPDPDEFSADVDSKYQTKTRATQEYERRCSKRARNKARRARAKGLTD